MFNRVRVTEMEFSICTYVYKLLVKWWEVLLAVNSKWGRIEENCDCNRSNMALDAENHLHR